MQSDSVDKIVSRYFASVTKKTFQWRGKSYHPRVLKISPLLLRDFTCPVGCGGCCPKFTLDFLPASQKPEGCEKRMVEFDGREVEIWSDKQEGNTSNRCKNLQPMTGRCGIYEMRPFSCDFELIRMLMPIEGDGPAMLTQKLFGRGWSYMRQDGGKGALCEMTPVTDKSVKEVLRKLRLLQDWTVHFGLETWVPEIIAIIEQGRLTKQIELRLTSDGDGFGL